MHAINFSEKNIDLIELIDFYKHTLINSIGSNCIIAMFDKLY